MTTTEKNRWEVVAKLVRERRSDLGLTQDEGVARADKRLSLAVWNHIENARQTKYRNRSIAGLCDALGWPPDAIDQILAGADRIEPVAGHESSFSSEVVGYVNRETLDPVEAEMVDAFIAGLLARRTIGG